MTLEFPDRVSIQTAPVETSDGHDGFTEASPVTRQSRWTAQVVELSGRELERARQIDPRISLEVRFRYWRAYREDLDGGRALLVWHASSNSADDRTLYITTPPTQVDRLRTVQVFCREAA